MNTFSPGSDLSPSVLSHPETPPPHISCLTLGVRGFNALSLGLYRPPHHHSLLLGAMNVIHNIMGWFTTPLAGAADAVPTVRALRIML